MANVRYFLKQASIYPVSLYVKERPMQASMPQKSGPYTIAGWTIDVDSDRLIRTDQIVKLEPKIMQVLICLIEHQGQIVSKDYLMQTVWPDVVVTDHPITRAISSLRKIFQDNPKYPQVIETISKKGYRLICSAEVVDETGTLSSSNGPLLATVAVDAQKGHIAQAAKRLLIPAFCLCLILTIGILPSGTDSGQAKELYITSPAISLTTSLGLEMDAAFSPDNQSIVFSHQSPESLQWDLYLKRLDGSETRLTDTVFPERHASFAPDRQKIAFVRKDEAGCRIISRSMADGAEVELLVEANKLILDLEWAPDGQSIVYSTRTTADSPYALFIFSPATGKKRQLTSPTANFYADHLLTFSPDGRQLIFARLDSQYNDDLYVMDMHTEQVRRLTNENQIIFGMDWLSLTDEIIFCIYDDGEYKLKSTDLEGNVRPVKFAKAFPNGTNPIVSPSGKLLSFQNGKFRKNIYKATVNTTSGSLGEAKTVITSSTGEWNAKVSPDGSKIVFVSDRSGGNELWLSNIDGSDLRMISQTNVPYNCMASWAPDGRSFVFATKPEEIYLTYRYILEDEGIELLASDAVVPVHSRDGSWIYFASLRSGDWRIWKIPAEGGEVKQVTHTNSFAPMESVDGQTLYYCKRGIAGIWEKTAKVDEEIVIEDLEIFDTQNWLVVEDGIYYLRRKQHRRPELVFFRFADKSSVVLANEVTRTNRIDDGFSLSPDGRDIYFSVNDHEEVDIKMIEIAIK